MEVLNIKSNNRKEIGRMVKIVFAEDILNAIKIISKKTWIADVPNDYIDLINDNYKVAVEVVKYAPCIYFKLSNKFKNNRLIVDNTIKSFSKHNRINEIDISKRPLVKRSK